MNFLYALKKKIKANDNLADILRYAYIPVVLANKALFDYSAQRRSEGKEDPRYISLRKYLNIHKGKRCFIVATGPSLKIADLELLKNEYTISMNSVYVSYTDTSWRPTYYVIQDPFVYEEIHEQINPEEYQATFVGSIVAEKFSVWKTDTVNIFPLDLLYQQIPNKKYHTKFSADIYSRIYSGYNVAYSALQIAVYMGFTEIYLIGADCNYLQDKKYFIEDKNRGSEKYFTERFLASNTDKFLLAYAVAKEYADKNDIKIYNATRGGLLEVYPRVDFDEVINNKNAVGG